MLGKEWHDSPHFKTLRMIGNKLHSLHHEVRQIVDLLETVDWLFPGVDLKEHYDVLGKHLNALLDEQRQAVTRFNLISSELTPTWSDRSVAFVNSEVTPHPNMRLE